MSDRAELQRLEARATPGPWEVLVAGEGAWATIDGPDGADVLTVDYRGPQREPYCWVSDADADLIVTARNALPSLLAELAEKDAEIERYRALVAQLQNARHQSLSCGGGVCNRCYAESVLTRHGFGGAS